MKIKLSYLVFINLLRSCSDQIEKTKPVSENITESVYASAIVKSKNQYEVFSTVSGIINKI